MNPTLWMILRVRINPRVIMIPGVRMNHRLRMNLRVRMIPKVIMIPGVRMNPREWFPEYEWILE